MRKRKIALIILLTFLASVFANLFYSNNVLTVNTINFNTNKTNASFRAVLVSDLHNREYGKNNKYLIKKIKELEPDIIFAVGDMVNEDEKSRDVCLNFFREAVKIADVYCCFGNHEEGYCDRKALADDVKKTGAHLLQNQMEQIEIGGGIITVAALNDYPYYEYYGPDYTNSSAVFFRKFVAQQEKNFSILLVHEPEFLLWGLQDNPIDLMLSGHTHGGIVRLPFIGGLIAPNQGYLQGHGDLLPKYDKGFFHDKNVNLIVTGGLGNSNRIPRFNNPPQITVINVNCS